jgi:hypothetical protein
MYLLGTIVTWMLTVWAVFEMNMLLTMLFGALSLLFAWLGRGAAGGEVHHHQHVHHHTYGPTYIDARSLYMADGRLIPFATPERIRRLEAERHGSQEFLRPSAIEAPRERQDRFSTIVENVELKPIDAEWSEIRQARQIPPRNSGEVAIDGEVRRSPQQLPATVTPRLAPPKKRQSFIVAMIVGPKKSA